MNKVMQVVVAVMFMAGMAQAGPVVKSKADHRGHEVMVGFKFAVGADPTCVKVPNRFLDDEVSESMPNYTPAAIVIESTKTPIWKNKWVWIGVGVASMLEEQMDVGWTCRCEYLGRG